MSEFASAAMLRVLLRGMGALGLTPPDVQPGVHAQIELRDKRALLESAIRQGGLSCLPRLGVGLHGDVDDPTHRALTAARDGLDLIDRWRRLERYVHSVHRTEWSTDPAGRVLMRHRGVRAGITPSPAESLVVLGVVAALLESIGLREVVASIDGEPVYPDPREASLQAFAATGRTGAWMLQWSDPATTVGASAPTGPAGGSLGAREPLRAPTNLCDALPWPEPAHQIARRNLADPLSTLTLAGAAHEIGIAARTLQRTLSNAGRSWTAVLGEARVRAASWWLLESRCSIAEIGFVSGYAGQAHFTRDFGRRIGVPPGRYRSDFGPARPGTAAPSG